MTLSPLYNEIAGELAVAAERLQSIPGPQRSSKAHSALRHALIAVSELQDAADEARTREDEQHLADQLVSMARREQAARSVV